MAGILDATSIGPVDVAGQRDLAFIRKSADGEASFVEMVDSDVSDAYASLTDDQFDLLNDVDLESMADGLEPATAALVIVWENSWAARLSTAVRNSGGFLIAQERVPRENVVAAIEALTAG